MPGQAGPLVRWVITTQAILTATAGMMTGFIWSWQTALLFALGGLIAIISTAVFALRAFAVDAATDAGGALRALYRGNAIKWAIAILVFATAAKYLGAQLLPMLLGYLLAGLSYKLALLKKMSPDISSE